MTSSPSADKTLRIAVIGAGPVGLALALQASRRLPQAQITVYDAAPAAVDVSGDPRTLALSQGSVQVLQRLGVWPQIETHAAAIRTVHVSQQQPALLGLLAPRLGALLSGTAWPNVAAAGARPAQRAGETFDASPSQNAEPELVMRAGDLGERQLGAVATYGAIVAPLRAGWLAASAAQPTRLRSRLGCKVQHIDAPWQAAQARVVMGGDVPDDLHDLVVVAEGGVFADQARKAVSRDYGQTAWIGTVETEGGEPGVAFERFTPNGPAALLPLPPLASTVPGRQRMALVWCLASKEVAARELGAEQRCAVLQSVFSPRIGRIVSVSPLKGFALGLNAERTLVQGRSVRIGNAAQTLHPVAGQGLNLGLRDAAVLVDRLARLRPGEDPVKSLRELDLERAPDRWSLIAGTDFLARSFTWTAPGLSTLRGAGIGLLQLATPVKKAVARHMMFGWR
ncbi:MAG: FAD-dependent monooxygenase [Burkholderiales bacterium]|nr:FAD-dependent monooxygenase [Burkholderiales bacterium]